MPKRERKATKKEKVSDAHLMSKAWARIKKEQVLDFTKARFQQFALEAGTLLGGPTTLEANAPATALNTRSFEVRAEYYFVEGEKRIRFVASMGKVEVHLQNQSLTAGWKP